jgi:hypothetical protein
VVLFCFVLTKQEITLTCHWLILFFDSTGVWTQGLSFARQVFYHLSYSASPCHWYLNRVPRQS